VSKRARHCENREFVDDIRDFLPGNGRAPETIATDVDGSKRLRVVVLNHFLNRSAHANENAENAGARLVEADITDEQMRAGLSGGGNEPECSAGYISRHREVA
jgi:hypothetical protein